MRCKIYTYPVRHPLLKNYIKCFWCIRADYLEINHKLIPQRNINLRFNLSNTPHLICIDNMEFLLEDIYFSGLQDHFMNAWLKLKGRVDMLGICFLPDGFYPFLKMPVSEVKNQLLGSREAGFKEADIIAEQLKNSSGIAERLVILEDSLVTMLNGSNYIPENFRKVFNILKQGNNWSHISEFCEQNNISIRKLERMYNKYVGVSPVTYNTLNRFHQSLNQLLYNDYSLLTDIAYDNGYFDQMHFIKDFKRFAGCTPKKILCQNNSLLQIGKFA